MAFKSFLVMRCDWIRKVLLLGFLLVLIATGRSAQTPTRPSTTLGIQESLFTRNDHPIFLLGFSYYGALGASEDFIRQDLDDMQRHGLNWLRVWATWGAFDHVISAEEERKFIRQAQAVLARDP